MYVRSPQERHFGNAWQFSQGVRNPRRAWEADGISRCGGDAERALVLGPRVTASSMSTLDAPLRALCF